jgi:ribosomal protein S17E
MESKNSESLKLQCPNKIYSRYSNDFTSIFESDQKLFSILSDFELKHKKENS